MLPSGKVGGDIGLSKISGKAWSCIEHGLISNRLSQLPLGSPDDPAILTHRAWCSAPIRLIPHREYCQKCGKEVDPKKAIWLEWDLRTAGPTLEKIPEQHSQGSFPYGPECGPKIKRLLKAGKKVSGGGGQNNI